MTEKFLNPVTLTRPAKSCGTAPKLLPGVLDERLDERVKQLPTFDVGELIDP